MLKKISKIFISLACMIITLHAIIPHHHHPDKPICMHLLNHQDCNKHDNCCDFDGHENHHHDFDKNNCIIDDLFAPKDENLTLTQTLTLTQMQTLTFDLFINTLIYDFILKEKEKIFRRNNPIFNYKNPLAIANIGLRAPPMLIHNA